MIPSLIFFPEKKFYEKPEDYQFQYENVSLQTSDQIVLHGWWIETQSPKKMGAILFLHGNAGNISHRLYKIKGWVERGFEVLLLDYRGYGKSSGKIQNQEDIVLDAHAGFGWMQEVKKIPASKTILYGESLGTYPAIRLGAENISGAVILEAPFTSFVELGRLHYPFVPSALIQNFAFANIEHIGNLKSPLFILHGTNDEICPYNMSGELFEKAPEPKGFLSIPNGTHNDLPISAGDDYWQKPFEFVSKHLSGRP